MDQKKKKKRGIKDLIAGLVGIIINWPWWERITLKETNIKDLIARLVGIIALVLIEVVANGLANWTIFWTLKFPNSIVTCKHYVSWFDLICVTCKHHVC